LPRDVYARRRLVAVAVAGLLAVAIVAVFDQYDPFDVRLRPAPPDRAAALVVGALRPLGRAISHALVGDQLPSGQRQRAAVARFARLGLPLFCGGTKGRYVALTFDDGPSVLSPQFADLLREFGVRATFFLIGRNVSQDPAAPRVDLQLGEVGDHTFSHPNITQLSTRDLTFEILHTRRLLAQATGGAITLFRPPYEARNPASDLFVHRHGLLQVLWDVDTRDSIGAYPAAIIQHAVAGLAPGNIILMHETYTRTLLALHTILPELRRRNLQPVTIPELLALDPPSEAQLRAGFQGCPNAPLNVNGGAGA
jgi:peptidoglycan/xylan/chitin deacetylase (PgdA/CDA1 family)